MYQYKEYNIFYTLSHIIFGILIYLDIKFFYLFIPYQIIQYIFNIRIYIPNLKIEKGCNFKHFLNKLLEHLLGYFIWRLINNIK